MKIALQSETCSICYNCKTARKLYNCTHSLCDSCYVKLNNCPYCRKPYYFNKKTNGEYRASCKILDKIMIDCSEQPTNPNKVMNNIGLLNRLFNRWIFYCKSSDDDDNDRTLVKPSIDRAFLDNIINYMRISDYPEERDVLKAKSMIVFEELAKQLKKFNQTLIPIQLAHLL